MLTVKNPVIEPGTEVSSSDGLCNIRIILQIELFEGGGGGASRRWT